jgi:hypothetical protein
LLSPLNPTKLIILQKDSKVPRLQDPSGSTDSDACSAHPSLLAQRKRGELLGKDDNSNAESIYREKQRTAKNYLLEKTKLTLIP